MTFSETHDTHETPSVSVPDILRALVLLFLLSYEKEVWGCSSVVKCACLTFVRSPEFDP